MASFDLKLQRARSHLDQLRHDSVAWIKTEPYGLVDEPDQQPLPEQSKYSGGQHRRFRVTRVDAVPESFSLLIGDCLHNLRNALDHITFALGQVNIRRVHKRRMTAAEEQGSEFPIFFDRAMRPDEERKKIGCVADAPKAIINALQPHLRGNAYRNDPLWQIHELNRIDKHRTLTTCITMPTARDPDGHIGWHIIDADKAGVLLAHIVYLKVTSGILKPEAIFARYTLVDLSSVDDPHVYMKPILPLQVTFDKNGPTPFQGVIPTLDALLKFVSDSVIPKLTQFL